MAGKPRPVKPVSNRAALPGDPPAWLGLDADEKRSYRELARLLQPQGTATSADVQAVAMTARVTVHLRRLEQVVRDLEELTVETKAGPRVHPLLVELRSTRAQLSTLYGQLMLNPRSRSACRVPKSERNESKVASDDLEDFLNG